VLVDVDVSTLDVSVVLIGKNVESELVVISVVVVDHSDVDVEGVVADDVICIVFVDDSNVVVEGIVVDDVEIVPLSVIVVVVVNISGVVGRSGREQSEETRTKCLLFVTYSGRLCVGFLLVMFMGRLTERGVGCGLGLGRPASRFLRI
jgi:hypothetical protein